MPFPLSLWHQFVVENCGCSFWRDVVAQIPIKHIAALEADRGRISINPSKYFDGVTPDLWAYQVLAKWLKDRKGLFLTSADTTTTLVRHRTRLCG